MPSFSCLINAHRKKIKYLDVVRGRVSQTPGSDIVGENGPMIHDYYLQLDRAWKNPRTDMVRRKRHGVVIGRACR